MVSTHEDPQAERTQHIITLRDPTYPQSSLSQHKDRWIEGIRRDCDEAQPKEVRYDCGKCQEDLDNQPKLIGCEGRCDRWFHTECVDLTNADFQQLLDDTTSKWICLECRTRSRKTPQEI